MFKRLILRSTSLYEVLCPHRSMSVIESCQVESSPVKTVEQVSRSFIAEPRLIRGTKAGRRKVRSKRKSSQRAPLSVSRNGRARPTASGIPFWPGKRENAALSNVLNLAVIGDESGTFPPTSEPAFRFLESPVPVVLRSRFLSE